MEIFNLFGDEWNVTTEHEGFAFKDSWVGARIGVEGTFRAGFTIEEIFNLTKIDRWFLVQIKEIVDFEEELATAN